MACGTLQAALEPIDHIKGALFTNMILNILANIFLGVVFPVMILQNLWTGNVSCVPGEGEQEKKLLEFIKKYLGVFFHIVKLVGAPSLGSTATAHGAHTRALSFPSRLPSLFAPPVTTVELHRE